MKDDRKTKEQLIRELTELRQRIAELKAAEVEHERVKKALQESRETARALLNTPADVVALVDTRGIVLDGNETTARRFGKSIDELVGLYCWDLLPPELAETRRAYADQVIQSGKPVRFEDGRQGAWYDNVFYPVLNEQGEVTKVAIWARDITERKQMEKELERRVQERTAELAASEAHYRTLFESNRDGLFIINMWGRYISVNPAACRLLGYSREELLALDVFQVGVKGRGISSDEQRAQLLEHFQGIWRQGMVKHEAELISKSGETISVEASIAPLTYRGQEAVLAAVRDVTARKQMEGALRESEERFRTIFQTVSSMITYVDTHGKILDVNDRVEDLLGYKRDAIIGKNFAKLGVLGLRDLPEVARLFRDTIKDREAMSIVELELKHESGKKVLVEVGTRFIQRNGKVEGIVNTFKDITERKQAEEELRRSQEETLRSHRLLLALSQATQAMQRAHTRREVYQAIGDEIAKLGYHAIVFTLTDDRKHLTILHTSLEPTLLQAAEKLAGLLAPDVRISLTPDSSFWPVITEGKSTLLEQIAGHERIAGHTAKGISKRGRSLIERMTAMLGIEKAIYAPLKISGETRNVLVVAGTDLTEADVPAITTFANQAAIALENARLLEQLNVSQKRLRQLAQQITSAQEKERQRLSRALHDEAGQALTALKISLQLVQDDLAAEPASLRQRLDDAVSLTDETMEGIRSLAQDLRPPALDAVGLNPTLEGFCRDFARRTQLSIDYLGAELPTLPETFSICFYRFLQEALANVAKHACASQVAVVLRCSTAKTITLSVEDDGQGFDRQATSSDPSWPRGIGLLGIQERFESLGGRIEVETQPGQGTRLVGHMPLQKAHDDDEEKEERQ